MKFLETTLWIAGVTLILLFVGAHAWAEIDRQRELDRFSELLQSADQQQPDPVASTAVSHIEAIGVAQSGPASSDEILAVLRAPVIGLELPVRHGTDEQILRRGPGVVEGTSLPGSLGNIAIAAHRDTHFRSLKNLELGDLIELEGPGLTQSYIVTDLSIVEPTDIHVLEENGQSVLTLVTCYPFTFVGNAPKRFIVRAEAAGFMH
jgi:sortase A